MSVALIQVYCTLVEPSFASPMNFIECFKSTLAFGGGGGGGHRL